MNRKGSWNLFPGSVLMHLRAVLKRFRRSERERFIGLSADHFEVERHEQAWDRWTRGWEPA